MFTQRFENGGKPVSTLEKKGKTKKTGTTITFKPDRSIFSTDTFQFDILAERLREAAFLLKGITIELVDERNEEQVEESYQYPDGLKQFVLYLNEEKDALHEVVAFEGEQQGMELDFAFQFNDGYAENILSFVNNVRTKDNT